MMNTLATLRDQNGRSVHLACTRHVYAESCRMVEDITPKPSQKHPEAMWKTQTTPGWTPKASRRLADDAEGLPKACGAPRSRPESNLLKLLKVRCRRCFDPESVPKASRKDAEGFPIIPKACRRYSEGGEFAIFAFGNASGTLRGPSGDGAFYVKHLKNLTLIYCRYIHRYMADSCFPLL